MIAKLNLCAQMISEPPVHTKSEVSKVRVSVPKEQRIATGDVRVQSSTAARVKVPVRGQDSKSVLKAATVLEQIPDLGTDAKVTLKDALSASPEMRGGGRTT